MEEASRRGVRQNRARKGKKTLSGATMDLLLKFPPFFFPKTPVQKRLTKVKQSKQRL